MKNNEGNIFVDGDIHDVIIYPLRKLIDERGWLAELFRHDEIDKQFHPQMAYVSVSEPNVQRGPHEHKEQSDLFCFIGASNFKVRLWDNRSYSPTYQYRMTLFVGADNPQSLIIPKGVVHAYKNIGSERGVVINCPNRLFKGAGRKDLADEIRYNDNPDTIFQMD